MTHPTSATSSHRGAPRHHLIRALALLIGSAVVGVALAPGPLQAQQAEPAAEGPAGFLQVTTVTVRPAGVLAFEEYAKKAVAAIAKVSGRPVQAYQNMYGNPNVYHFTVSLTAAKDLDSLPTVPQAIMKAYGEAEGARLLAAGRAVIDSVLVERHNTSRRLSTNLRTGVKPSRYYQVMRTIAKPEMIEAYTNILEKVKKAEEAQPNAVTAFRRGLGEGGPNGTFLVVRGFDSFEERAGWANQRQILRKVYGEVDERLMNETISRALAARENMVLAHRADLSSQ